MDADGGCQVIPMTIRIATIAACAGALIFMQASDAQAQDQRRGGFIIPLVAKTDSGKPGKAGQGRVVSPRDAASGTPQNRTVINTSRSNIKHGGPGIADKGGTGGSKLPGATINTSRSNIKQNPS